MASSVTMSFREKVLMMELRSVDQSMDGRKQLLFSNHNNDTTDNTHTHYIHDETIVPIYDNYDIPNQQNNQTNCEHYDINTTTTTTLKTNNENDRKNQQDLLNALYEMDTFMDNKKSKPTTTEATTPEQYMADLYAVDLYMESIATTKQNENDTSINIMKELLTVDRQAAHSYESPYDHLFHDLWMTDCIVDRRPTKQQQQNLRFLDHIADDLMFTYTNASQSSQSKYNQNLAELSHLLLTDLEVDTMKQYTSEMDDIAPLLRVDHEVAGINTESQYQSDVHDIMALFVIDESIKHASPMYHDNNTTTTSTRNVTTAAATDTEYSVAIADLYTMDLEMDSRANTKHNKQIDAMDVMTELLQVDRQVEPPQYDSPPMTLIKDLYMTDCIVDRRTTTNRNTAKFVDPVSDDNKLMFTYTDEAHMIAMNDEYKLSEVSHLLITDMEVDGKKQYAYDMEDVAALLQVDNEVSGRTKASQYRSDVEAVMSLHMSDKKIDGDAKQMKNDEGKSVNESNTSVVATAEQYMADLYAVDLYMESIANSKLKNDSLRIMKDLLSVDRQVERATYDDKYDETFRDLWTIDCIVDRQSYNNVPKFYDQTVDDMMFQYDFEIQSAQVNYNQNLSELSHLLAIDLEVDTMKQYTSEMDSVAPLLRVDHEVAGFNASSQFKSDIQDIMSLLSIDKQVTAAAPLQIKETSFDGEKVSKVDQETVEAVAGLYANDLSVEGHSKGEVTRLRRIFTQTERVAAVESDVFSKQITPTNAEKDHNISKTGEAEMKVKRSIFGIKLVTKKDDNSSARMDDYSMEFSNGMWFSRD